MHTQIFLDCSASMGKADPDKANYAVAMAAALGFLSVHNMDKVSFKLIRGDRAEDPFGLLVGKRAFFRAVSELENLTFTGDSDIGTAVTSCETGTRDGLTVIISDFFTDSDWRKAVNFLKYKSRQVLLVQVLTREELDPTYNGHVSLIDSESEDMMDDRNMKMRINRGMLSAYGEAMKDFQNEIAHFCASRDVGFMSVNTQEPIERVLFGELLKVGILQ